MISYLGRKIATMDDANFSRKKVLLRVDLNSPVDPKTGSLLDVSRIVEHSATVRELVERGAAVVVMSHQGRPLDSDYVSLAPHAEALSKAIGQEVKFVEDIAGPAARAAVERAEPGEVVMLDNTRFMAEDNVEAPPEKHADSVLVSRLSPLFSYFVNDAFATSHRSQATIVGFPLRLPSFAGRVMERELRALNRVVEMPDRPKVFVLGGAKLDDTYKVVKHVVQSGIADEVLTGGLVAVMFLMAKGVEVPKEVAARVMTKIPPELFHEAKEFVRKHDNVVTPHDFAVETKEGVTVSDAHRIVGAPKDIGPATVERYKESIMKAKIVVMRGPAGVIEDPRFRAGTEALVRTALESSAFTVFGGGHFISMAASLPREERARIGHISTGGGALLYFLAGNVLPGLEALARSSEKFKLSA
ncbi:MAG: phosphoglycerate kinase [Acidilobaceae archaeon]|nr:phosphoglycerate kinase [Acidilobaceae archaeon]MCX8165644.1 phosphoglycerate kinase [Acidilobaceae archaeon]MDW7974070.1 phosphoglycerate kinase [Sulfolobales archaeon]